MWCVLLQEEVHGTLTLKVDINTICPTLMRKRSFKYSRIPVNKYSMHICVCVCVCMCVCLYVCVYVCKCVYVYVCIYM